MGKLINKSFGSVKFGGLTLMLGNSKLGRVMHINLPPPKCCDHALPCYGNGCYAMKFWRLRKVCRDTWTANWDALMKDRDAYFGAVAVAINHKLGPGSLFRWHSAGDIPDLDYLHRMIRVARAFPQVRFWSTTKKYDLARIARRRWKFPANFNLVISAWPGKPLPRNIAAGWPTAWMRDPENPDPRIPPEAFECGGGCDTCGHCWQMRKGESVVFDKH